MIGLVCSTTGWLALCSLNPIRNGTVGLGSGFYVWSAALWIPTLAAAYVWRESKREGDVLRPHALARSSRPAW